MNVVISLNAAGQRDQLLWAVVRRQNDAVVGMKRELM